jgi:hypothetical protein
MHLMRSVFRPVTGQIYLPPTIGAHNFQLIARTFNISYILAAFKLASLPRRPIPDARPRVRKRTPPGDP